MGLASSAFKLSASEAIILPILVAVMIPFGLPAFMFPVALAVSAGLFVLGNAASKAAPSASHAVTIEDYFVRLGDDEFDALIRAHDDRRRKLRAIKSALAVN